MSSCGRGRPRSVKQSTPGSPCSMRLQPASGKPQGARPVARLAEVRGPAPPRRRWRGPVGGDLRQRRERGFEVDRRCRRRSRTPRVTYSLHLLAVAGSSIRTTSTPGGRPARSNWSTPAPTRRSGAVRGRSRPGARARSRFRGAHRVRVCPVLPDWPLGARLPKRRGRGKIAPRSGVERQSTAHQASAARMSGRRGSGRACGGCARRSRRSRRRCSRAAARSRARRARRRG